MKIILCGINSKYIHSSLGIWYLYSAAKTINHNEYIYIYETTINNQAEDTAMDLVCQNADVIGFSCYIWNVEYIKKTVQIIKMAQPNLKIFLGGPEASFDAENLLKTLPIDYIIKGEGEEAFLQLLAQNFASEEKIIEKPCDNYHNPYSTEYMQALMGRIAYIETSRGCPFNCAFCLSGRDENVRFFDLEQSKENIIKLANSGTQTVKFVDRTFNCNDKRALEIFKFIAESREQGIINNNVVFHFEIEADLFTKETLNYLATVPKGLFQFEAGLQSFNTETLKGVNRRHNMQKMTENLKAIAGMGNIHLHIDLIAGLPFEDYNSFVQGFNLAYTIRANVIQLGFLKLLKGSPLEKQKDIHGYKYCHWAPYQVVSNNYISYNDITKLKIAEDAVERLLNSGRFTNTLEYILKSGNLSPYNLFFNFGNYIKQQGINSPSLDLYSKLLLEYFASQERIDNNILRDTMAQDRIITDKSGKLPLCLHINDKQLKDISFFLKTKDINLFESQTEKAKQGKLGFCIQYSGIEKQIIIADYTEFNPVTLSYRYKKLPFSIVEIYNEQ